MDGEMSTASEDQRKTSGVNPPCEDTTYQIKCYHCRLQQSLVTLLPCSKMLDQGQEKLRKVKYIVYLLYFILVYFYLL